MNGLLPFFNKELIILNIKYYKIDKIQHKSARELNSKSIYCIINTNN